MKKSAIVIVVILAALFLYFGMPVFNFRFLKLPLMLAALLLALLVLSSRAEGTGKKATLKPAAAARPLLIAIGAIVAYIVVMSIASAPMFRSDAYRALIGNIKNGTDIHHHITPLDIDNVRVVDQDLAYLLGEKILGSEPALGSKTTLGDFNIQKVNGKLYWVAPLLHSGFFKWVNNRQGTPGYVMVSATNERDVKLVEQVGGTKLAIKYQPGAFFFRI
jgi:predicted membrane protein